MIEKEIYVEIKRSMNFQTYTAGTRVSIEDGEDPEAVRAQAYAICRKSLKEQMALDGINLR